MAYINQFGGIIPKTADHLLASTAAIKAHDVKLRDGKIKPWREPKALALAIEDALTVYMYGCCPLTWDTCVSVATWIPDGNRIFITGREPYPEVVTVTNCIPKYYRLGVYTPVMAPLLQYTSSTIVDQSSARAYLYTFINIFGEESAPSTASTQITVVDGASVTVSGFFIPPLEYGISSIRLYRSETGFRDGREKEQIPITEWLLVSEVPIGTTSIVDNKKVKDLGPALSTREVREPPETLRHITSIEGTGLLSGVTRNKVHFSANFQPWNWPAEQDLTLDHNIINYVSVGQQTFVSTDGVPYVIDASIQCEPRQCRATDGSDIVLPDIGCGYAHSAIATPFGMVYSSREGLVLVRGNATVEVITGDWFSSETWLTLLPTTVRLVYWRGYLICRTDMITFMLQLDGSTYKDMTIGALTTLSDEPVDMSVSSSGELILLEDGIVKQWDASDTLRPYSWISRPLGADILLGFTGARIKTEGTTFGIISDTGTSWERQVVRNKPFRIKRLGRHREFYISFEGTGVVEYVRFGVSIRALGGTDG